MISHTSDRLILLRESRGSHAPRFNSFTNAAYLAWRKDATTTEDIAAWSQRIVRLTFPGAGDPERTRITAASASAQVNHTPSRAASASALSGPDLPWC
jgi:hypothetical protein